MWLSVVQGLLKNQGPDFRSCCMTASRYDGKTAQRTTVMQEELKNGSVRSMSALARADRRTEQRRPPDRAGERNEPAVRLSFGLRSPDRGPADTQTNNDAMRPAPVSDSSLHSANDRDEHLEDK